MERLKYYILYCISMGRGRRKRELSKDILQELDLSKKDTREWLYAQESEELGVIYLNILKADIEGKEEDIYGRQISIILKKDPTTLAKQLTVLEKFNFIEAKREGGLHNKTIYKPTISGLAQVMFRLYNELPPHIPSFSNTKFGNEIENKKKDALKKYKLKQIKLSLNSGFLQYIIRMYADSLLKNKRTISIKQFVDNLLLEFSKMDQKHLRELIYGIVQNMISKQGISKELFLQKHRKDEEEILKFWHYNNILYHNSNQNLLFMVIEYIKRRQKK